MAAVHKCANPVFSASAHVEPARGSLSRVQPTKEEINQRARNFADMRSAPAIEQSWLGQLVSVTNRFVKGVAESMNPSAREVDPWLAFVRKSMETLGPIFVGKPVGVVSEPFVFNPVEINAQDDNYVRSVELNNTQHKKPSSVAGEWVRPEYYDLTRSNSERKVVIYLPGGGYHLGNHLTHGAITGRIARDAHCEVCVVDYSLLPEHAYPAALNDVITVINNLIKQGYKLENMTFSGDSAGGHLAALIVQYIQQEIKAGRFNTDSGLACNSAVLISPVVDFNLEDEKYKDKSDDLLPHEPMPHVARNLARHLSEHLSSSSSETENILDHPVVSPVKRDFGELGDVHPPVFLSYGKDEILGIGANDFYEKLVEAKIPAYQDVGPIAHTGHLFSGYIPEAEQMMTRCTDFIAHMLKTAEQREADARKAFDEGYMDVEGFPL